MVPYFGGRLTFQVIGVTPARSDAVLVTQKAIFSIAEKGQMQEEFLRSHMRILVD